MRLFLAVAAALAASAVIAQPAPPPPAPAGFTNSPACFGRFTAIGMPIVRSESQREEEVAPMCRRGYAFGWNGVTRNPDWVMEHLSKTDLTGPAQRKPGGFKADTELLGDKAVKPSEYDKTNFDRGHQAPAGDDKFDQAVMDDSFFMSNMAPQVGPSFNRGEWKYLEEQVRAWVICGGHDDVYVITGPIYGPAAAHFMTGPNTVADHRIRVPDGFYKIVYDPNTRRAVGFVLENKAVKKVAFDGFITPIADIEDRTGLDFFPTLNQHDQNLIEANKGELWGHAQACTGSQTD